MREISLKCSLLAILTFVVLCIPTFASSAGYYTLASTTATWDGTLNNRLTTPTADYNYTYGDEKSVTYTLPWTVAYYGRAFSQITADTNGNVWFGAPNTAYSFNLAATTAPVLAAWNTDLDSTYTGGVFIQHKTTPERVVIEWQTKPYFEGAQLRPPSAFSVVLFQDGTIRVDYGTLVNSSAVDSGSGISRGDGVGTQYLSTTAAFGDVAMLTNHSYLFTPQPTTSLAVAVSGPGVVSSAPGGINCGTTCSNSFSPETVVTLTAAPNPGSGFTGWSGACTGTGTCTVAMSAAQTVTAAFVAAPTVTINSPAGTISNHHPSIAYSTSAGTVVVKIDGTVVGKVSGDTLDALATGPHTLRVEATNLGATGFAESNFTITAAQPLIITGQGLSSALYTVPAGDYGAITITDSFVSFTGDIYAESISLSSSYVAATGDMNVSSDVAMSDSQIDADSIVNARNIFASSYSWIVANKPVTVAQELSLAASSTLTHPWATLTTTSKLRVIAGTVSVDATSSFDVTGRGYLGGWQNGAGTQYSRQYGCYSPPAYAPGTDVNTSDFGRTLGNIPGSDKGNGGGYGGPGGVGYRSSVINATYGDFMFPDELGSGGSGIFSQLGVCNTVEVSPGGNGGGAVHLTATNLNLAGSIAADGVARLSGGSGGSIWIEAATITGNGVIHADASYLDNGWGGGGGGRVAVYYRTTSIPASHVTANGTEASGLAQSGTIGTVYLHDNDDAVSVNPIVLIYAPIGSIRNAAPVLAYAASAGTVVVKLDGAAINKVSGNKLDTIADGTHTLRVEVTNNGHVGVAETTFTVDTIAPVVTLDTIAPVVYSDTLTISGAVEAGVNLSISATSSSWNRHLANVGTVTFGSGTWSCQLTDLAFGENTVGVIAIDAAGNSAYAFGTITRTLPMSLSLSNSSIPADYLGSVGVTVSGFTAGSPVLVEQFVDRNHNGIIEAGDYALRSFTITDGFVANGQNTAGDEDGAANGTITTSLDYRMLEDVYHAPGRYIFRATSGIASTTTLLTVTPVGQLQLVSGLVSDGVNPVPGALVQLTDKWGRHVSWTTSDELGTYYVDVKQPGSYQLMAYAPGFVDSTTPISLATSQSVANTTLALTAGAYAVTGTVADATTSAGIGSVWVQARNGATSSVAITAANGTYSFTLPAGTYSVTALAGDHVPGTSARGYVGFDNLPATVSVSGTTSVPTIPLTAGSVQFTGTVKDGTGTPVQGVPVRAKTQNAVDVREPVSYSVSKADGSFSLGVFAGSNWDISLDNAVAQTLGYLGTSKLSLATATSPLVGNDLVVKPITAWFQGTVTDSTSAVLPNIEVTLRNADSSVAASVFTAADGSYRIGAYAGTWYLDALTGVIAEQASTILDGQTKTLDFVKDVTPPSIVITSPATGLTSDNTPLLTFTANEGTPVVKVDGLVVSKVSGNSLDALANGNHVVRVESTDASGNLGFAEIAFTVNYMAPSITTTTLQNGFMAAGYSQTLAATGGITPYTWSFTGTLPAGLAMSPAGVISGTPSAVGTSSFTVKATDAEATVVTKALSITIFAQPTVSTSSLANGTTGTAYSQTLAATGGAAPYVWSLQAGCTLPAGLSLSTGGVISGTPTASGTSDFTVVVTDANTAVATKAISITVVNPLSITTASLPDGYLTTAYSAPGLAATGGSGTGYVWTNTTAMPSGLLLSSAGVITGTPTAAGTTSVTFKVTDSAAATATKVISITVYAKPSISTMSLAAGVTGTAYTATVAATGGKTAYVWSVSVGSLPAGLTIAQATGVISGTPTAAGTSNFTVQVADANGVTTTKALSIVVANPALSITTTTLADGYLTTAYSAPALAATGGSGTGYVWTNTTAMPAGLTLSTGGVITGIPTASGTTSVTFKVTDSAAATATKAISIVVYALPAITTTTLPNGVTGTAYSQTLAATGGKATLVWTSSTLPAGLTLSSGGVITGTPTATGTTSVTFTVTDANGKVATKAISITVTAPKVSVLNAWTNISNTTASTTSGTIAAGSVTASGGTNRLMLVAVTMKTGSSVAPTINVTLGGTALTLAKQTAAGTESIWVGYAKEAAIGSGAKAISVSYSGATGNALSTHVKWAVFNNVNQTTPVYSSAAANTTTTSATFGSAVNYVVGGMTTAIAANGGSSATGAITATTPAFATFGTATKSTTSSNTFTIASAHTAAGSYASTTAVSWTGTTGKMSATVAVSLQP